MIGSRVAFVVFTALTLAESCCCCLRWLPEPPETVTEADDPAIERAARARAETDGRSMLAASDAAATSDAGTVVSDASVDAGAPDAGEPDAGPRRSGCASGLGALALDLGVAIISRGHAGGEAAAEVTFNPAACARKLVVHLVKKAGAWIVVAMVVYDVATDEELARTGDVPEFSEDSDHDFGSDELF